MGLFSKIFDDVLGFDPNGGGIYSAARDVLGDTVADDWLGMDPNGGGAIKAYNVLGPAALTLGAASYAAPFLSGVLGSAAPAVGNGAFLGEGVASGIPAWDAAMAAASPGVASSVAGGAGQLATTGLNTMRAGELSSYATNGAMPISAAVANGVGGIPWAEIAGRVGGDLLSTGAQLYGANKAAGAMQNATTQANDLQRYTYDTTRADNAPALAARNSALSQMQALLKDPSTLTQQPGYQFGIDQGLKTLNSGAAARGMSQAGGTDKARIRYGQDYAGTKLDASFNRLSSLASAGQPGAGQIGAATANYGNNVGANTMNQGDANAMKYLVGGNAAGTAINGLTAYGQSKGWWQP